MHAEEDATGGDGEGGEGEFEAEFGIEDGEGGEDGESGDGVSGGEAESIGGQESGPAMRLDVAGAAAAGEAFGPEEESNAGAGGEEGGANGKVAFRAAIEGDGNGEEGPEPAVSATGGADHPEANPLRRAPAVNAVHQTVVACFDKVADERENAHSTRSSGSSEVKSAVGRPPRPESMNCFEYSKRS